MDKSPRQNSALMWGRSQLSAKLRSKHVTRLIPGRQCSVCLVHAGNPQFRSGGRRRQAGDGALRTAISGALCRSKMAAVFGSSTLRLPPSPPSQVSFALPL